MFEFTILNIFIVTLIGIVSYYIIKSKRANSKIRQEYVQQNIAYANMPNFFISMIKKKRQDLIEHELVLKNGKVFGVNLMSFKTIYIAEPELIQLVLSKEFTSFTNRRVSNCHFQ